MAYQVISTPSTKQSESENLLSPPISFTTYFLVTNSVSRIESDVVDLVLVSLFKPSTLVLLILPLRSLVVPPLYSNNRGMGRPPMRGNHSDSPNSRNTTPSTPYSNYLQPQNKCFSQYFSTNHTKPICQICQKPNHSAIDCYHRMKFANVGKQLPHKIQAMATTTPATQAVNHNSSDWVLDSKPASHLTNQHSWIFRHHTKEKTRYRLPVVTTFQLQISDNVLGMTLFQGQHDHGLYQIPFQ